MELSVETNEDLDWTSKQITYGLYLSDHSILNDVETELTVLSGIMIQNLPRETAWHLRGTRRIGVSKEDVETLQQCVCGKQIAIVGSMLTTNRLSSLRAFAAYAYIGCPEWLISNMKCEPFSLLPSHIHLWSSFYSSDRIESEIPSISHVQIART